MKLIELDLSKRYFWEEGQRKGRENTNAHPDIKTDSLYLCKIDDKYFVGKFRDVWFGLSFDGWFAPLQYDRPNTNSSTWQGIWEIVE